MNFCFSNCRQLCLNAQRTMAWSNRKTGAVCVSVLNWWDVLATRNGTETSVTAGVTSCVPRVRHSMRESVNVAQRQHRRPEDSVLREIQRIPDLKRLTAVATLQYENVESVDVYGPGMATGIVPRARNHMLQCVSIWEHSSCMQTLLVYFFSPILFCLIYCTYLYIQKWTFCAYEVIEIQGGRAANCISVKHFWLTRAWRMCI